MLTQLEVSCLESITRSLKGVASNTDDINATLKKSNNFIKIVDLSGNMHVTKVSGIQNMYVDESGYNINFENGGNIHVEKQEYEKIAKSILNEEV